MKYKLKSCPFCGGEAELCIDESGKVVIPKYLIVFVRCRDCKSRATQYIAESGYEDESAHKAIKAWNRRDE